MESLSEFVAYFKQIADNHLVINESFIHASFDSLSKLIADSRSKIVYPCLLLETPDYQLGSNGVANNWLNPESAILVLGKAEKDDYSQQLQVLDDTLEIMKDIIAKMKKDSRENIIKLPPNVGERSLTAVSPLGPDYLIGWRLEFSLHNPISICYNPAKWKS